MTCQNRDVFLFGLRELEPLAYLKQLPTIRQVLQRFHEHLYTIKSVGNASHVTIDELLIVWCKAAIPAVQKTHAIEKLEKIHSIWLLLKKNKGRESEAQMKRETDFKQQLDMLFDIAHIGAMSKIRINEDRDFLADQRGERKMYIDAEDKVLAEK